MRNGLMLVDDEEKILEAVDRELLIWRLQRGFELYCAKSVKEALKLLKVHHAVIAVLVCDLRMVELDGDQLIIEAKNLYPEIRSILITGYAELAGISRAVSAGISAFIQKPWETSKFIAELEKAFAESEAKSSQKKYLRQLKSQLENTGRIQRNLFETNISGESMYSLSVTYQPLSEFHCGGDFYHIVPVSNEKVVVILGDVSGHGIDAAFITGIIRTLITHSDFSDAEVNPFSPSTFIRNLNRSILKELAPAPELVFTLSVAYIDCPAKKLVFSNAGNMPIYLVGHNFCVPYSVEGIPCGSSPDAAYIDAVVSLEHVLRLVMMTDGLVERGRIAGFLNAKSIQSLMQHLVGEEDFNSLFVKYVLEMFPNSRFLDDMTLITTDIGLRRRT